MAGIHGNAGYLTQGIGVDPLQSSHFPLSPSIHPNETFIKGPAIRTYGKASVKLTSHSQCANLQRRNSGTFQGLSHGCVQSFLPKSWVLLGPSGLGKGRNVTASRFSQYPHAFIDGHGLEALGTNIDPDYHLSLLSSFLRINSCVSQTNHYPTAFFAGYRYFFNIRKVIDSPGNN
jgi:hypothetical protein